jgi:hypothetical protein
VREHAFDFHNRHLIRELVVDGKRFVELQIPNDDCLAADTQGVGDAGDEKDQSDIWIAQELRNRTPSRAMIR